MSGTIPLSLSQQLDKFGKPLSGGLLYIIQAGTTSAPQIAYQDAALTIPYPGGSKLTLDSAGRLGQFFLADGLVKIRLTDQDGLVQIEADGVQVIGPSSGGGGGGGSVDPTTVLSTGDLKIRYSDGVLSGFVRANGRTIGSSTSGGTERANADCQALFEYLWSADANLVVSTGRGASANADWTANKTIAIPDWRGRVIAGMDTMGATSADRLSTVLASTTLGASGGVKAPSITKEQLPNVAPVFSGTTDTITVTSINTVPNPAFFELSGNANTIRVGSSESRLVSTGSFTPRGSVASINGNVAQQALPVVQPTAVATIYVKL